MKSVKEVLASAGQGVSRGKGKNKGGGAKKIGRNKAKCARYRSAGIREKNKARKAVKQKTIEAKNKAKRES